MTCDDVAMREVDEMADRIASEYGISELRGESVEGEARKSLAVIQRWVQEIAKVVECQVEAEEEHDFSAWDDVKGGCKEGGSWVHEEERNLGGGVG